jgi:hypothetical protein
MLDIFQLGSEGMFRKLSLLFKLSIFPENIKTQEVAEVWIIFFTVLKTEVSRHFPVYSPSDLTKDMNPVSPEGLFFWRVEADVFCFLSGCRCNVVSFTLVLIVFLWLFGGFQEWWRKQWSGEMRKAGRD